MSDEEIVDIQASDAAEPDEFANGVVIPGLEHLGRAILDKNGVPSGSPANYEAKRGATTPGPSQEFVDQEIAKIKDLFND